MAQGIKAWRRIQMGKEATAGTAVAATSYWRGLGTIQDNRTEVFPDEDIGILPGVDRTYVPKVEALLTLDPIPATFEQVGYIFQMGICDSTSSTDANGFKWDYDFPVQTSDARTVTDLRTYTFEGGDNAAAEEFAYGHVRSFTLSGTAGEALMMSAEVVGRQVAPTSDGSFTAGLSIPAVTEILFSKGSLYIDGCASTDTIGTTQVSNEFLSMDLSVNTGWLPVYTGDGNIYFSFVKQTMPEVILQITLEHNTKAIAEIAAWRAQTARQIRVQFDGATGNQLILDIAGKWDNFEKIGERDGNDIVTGVFRGRYNSTAALFFETEVHCSTLSALP
jgi:hypothetical protein